MDLQLENRVALVVGGAGYIGSAVVRRLRAEGATVVIAGRTRETLDALASDVGASAVILDAADDDSIAVAVASVIAEHGRLDALVVSAAPSARTLDPARNSDPAQVLAAIDAKALGFLRVANAVIPSMTAAGYGRVVGISGQNALVTGNITGSIRNAALIIAAKNLADAAAGSGVTVTTVSPGIVTAQPDAPQQGRPGECTPEQIADLVAFLASPLSAGISGESIAVGHRIPGAVSM